MSEEYVQAIIGPIEFAKHSSVYNIVLTQCPCVDVPSTEHTLVKQTCGWLRMALCARHAARDMHVIMHGTVHNIPHDVCIVLAIFLIVGRCVVNDRACEWTMSIMDDNPAPQRTFYIEERDREVIEGSKTCLKSNR